MEAAPLTFNALVALLGFVAACGALWWRIEAAIDKVKTAQDEAVSKAHTEAKLARDELAKFREVVAVEYVRNSYLRDMEERVLNRIGELVNEIHNLRGEINLAMKAGRARARS